jgi:hypothetical protein
MILGAIFPRLSKSLFAEKFHACVAGQFISLHLLCFPARMASVSMYAVSLSRFFT